jgi:hypothetical protein
MSRGLTTNVNYLRCKNDDYLHVSDIADTHDYELKDCAQQNISNRQAIKEIYKYQYYLFKTKVIDNEPCPICLFGTVRTKRTCRYCGIISCATCCENRWHAGQDPSKSYKDNHSIENKRCNICHSKCKACKLIYPKNEDHVCPESD